MFYFGRQESIRNHFFSHQKGVNSKNCLDVKVLGYGGVYWSRNQTHDLLINTVNNRETKKHLDKPFFLLLRLHIRFSTQIILIQT